MSIPGTGPAVTHLSLISIRMLWSQQRVLSLPRFLGGSLFIPSSPPQLLPAHQPMVGTSADGLHGNLPSLWPRRCTKLARGKILPRHSSLSFSLSLIQGKSPHCSILHPGPVLSLLKTLPPFLSSPSPQCRFPVPEEDLGLQMFPVTVISSELYCLHPSVRGTSCPYL